MPSPAFAVLLAVCMLAALAARWMRWRSLCLRCGLQMPARPGLLVFAATLPAVLTPLGIGEVARGLFFPRQPGRWPRVLKVFLVERAADLLVLALLWVGACAIGVARGSSRTPVAVAAAAGAVLVACWPRRAATARRASVGFLLPCLASLFAWLIPAAGLWVGLRLAGAPACPVVAAGLLAEGTLKAGATGLPAGVGVAGAAWQGAIERQGLGPDAAAALASAFHAGTTWFAVGLGVAAAVLGGRRLWRLCARPDAPAGHFDAIASVYAGQIPPHVRERLLRRKVEAMVRMLGPPGARAGLDLGCGQGWYAIEMARRGFRMSGCDLSPGQVERARAGAAAASVAVDLQAASGDRLPFADASFDFAYAINVFHHISDPASRAGAFAEVVRVLKPGGLFFLHEINVTSPLNAVYMDFVFPVVNAIDDGTEQWLRPGALPPVAGAAWDPSVTYFTFLPDFIPAPLLAAFSDLEARLERSGLRRYSAHYLAVLRKDLAPSRGTAQAE